MYVRLLTSLLVIGTLAIVTLPSYAFDFSFGYQRNDKKAVKALPDVTVSKIKDGDKKDDLIDVIKGIVNRVLGILALICLILVIYGGILMVTSGGDDKNYSQGRSILKSALIGIAIIGVAWFIISIILWLIQQTGGTAEGASAGTDK